MQPSCLMPDPSPLVAQSIVSLSVLSFLLVLRLRVAALPEQYVRKVHGRRFPASYSKGNNERKLKPFRQ